MGSVVCHGRSSHLGRRTTTITVAVVPTSSSSSRGQSIALPSTANPTITILHRALPVGKSAPARNFSGVPPLVAIGIGKRHASDAKWPSRVVIVIVEVIMLRLVSLMLRTNTTAIIATLGRRIVLMRMAIVRTRYECHT